jgi:dihydroorotase
LNRLEAFASENGPRFYGLPLNTTRIVLERTSSQVPDFILAASTRIVPFHAGQTLAWRFAGHADADATSLVDETGSGSAS